VRRRIRPVVASTALVLGLAAVQGVGVATHALRGGEPPVRGLAALPASLRADDRAERDVDAYAGPGTWVDVYDIGATGDPPTVTPADVDAMAEAGVRTIYLQAARDQGRGRPGVVAPAVLGAFLVRAHEHDMRVVGWYLPRFGDVDRDLAHLEAIATFEVFGHRFDGIAVDIEWTDDVPGHRERSARLVELSQRLREAVGDEALGAIVMPPVHLEEVNTDLWPGFPWEELADLYDVWLPMGYWTVRTPASGFRDAARYTDENLARLRGHVGDDAVVHPIGGLAEDAGPDDVAGFAAQARRHDSIGASLYDWATARPGAQLQLATALGG
jgi:hypothetical protein